MKHLAIGTYTLLVHDHSAIHNFDLFGPDVTAQTDVAGVGDQTFTITITDGTYNYVCDAHPTQMKGSFTAGNVSTPPPPLPVKPVVKTLTASIGPAARRRLSPRAAFMRAEFKLTVSDRTRGRRLPPGRAGRCEVDRRQVQGHSDLDRDARQGKYSYGSVRNAKLRRSFTVSG